MTTCPFKAQGRTRELSEMSCNKGGCELWDSDMNCCSIKTIAIAQYHIAGTNAMKSGR